MITPKMMKWAIIILVGIIAILCLFTCKGCKDPKAPVIVPPAKIVKAVEDTEAVYKVKFDSINAVNANLKSINTSTLSQLQAAQARGKYLAAELRRRPNGDTTIIEGGVEAVNGTVDEYISNSEQRDTLCNKAIGNLQSQVANRERLITEKDTLYSRLRSSFDFTISQQEALITYNKQLKRQIKRKKVGNFIWKATTIAAGLFILKQNL